MLVEETLVDLTKKSLEEMTLIQKGGIDHGTSIDHDIAMIARKLQAASLDCDLSRAAAIHYKKFPSKKAKGLWLQKLEQEAAQKFGHAMEQARQQYRDHKSYLEHRRKEYERAMEIFGSQPLPPVRVNDPKVAPLPRRLTPHARSAEEVYLQEVELQNKALPEIMWVTFGAVGVHEETARKLVQIVINEST